MFCNSHEIYLQSAINLPMQAKPPNLSTAYVLFKQRRETLNELPSGFQGHSCAQLQNDVKGRNMSCGATKLRRMGRTLYVESVWEIRNDGEMQLENTDILPTTGLSH